MRKVSVKSLWDTPGDRKMKNMKKKKTRIREANSTKFCLQKLMLLDHVSLLGAPGQGKIVLGELFGGMDLETFF